MVSESSAPVPDPYRVQQTTQTSTEHDTSTSMMSTTTFTLSEITDASVSHKSPHNTHHNAPALSQARLKEAHGMAENGYAFNLLSGPMRSELNAL